MICYDCGKELKSKVGLYHYTESGLENVYLDGVEVFECANKSCRAYKGKTAAIEKIDLLHRLIVEQLIAQEAPLSGKAAKFLRKFFGIKAKEWADYLMVGAQTVSRWENENEAIGQQSEALIRLIALKLLEEQSGELIKAPKLAEIIKKARERKPARVIFSPQRGGYQIKRGNRPTK
jgi:DNA-binding transcriptional regulator YiaG